MNPLDVPDVDPIALATIVGVDITNCDGRKNDKAPPADTNAREKVDPIPPAVQDALDHPVLKKDGSVDQSKTTHHIASECGEIGLSLEAARWAVDQDPGLAARVAKLLARSSPRDDVKISWEQARARNAWAIPVTAPQQAPGGQQPAPGGVANAKPSLGGLYDLTDARIGAYIAETYLKTRFLHSGAFGWMEYDGRRWAPVSESVIGEAVRIGVLELYVGEVQINATPERLKAISSLFSASRIFAIVRIAKGCLARGGAEFDSQPHLLNVGNGVVDLRDGSLSPHDPKLLLTKITETEYHPGATHPDWDKALTAVTPEEAVFLQERLGHGLTAYPPSDDRLIVLKGSGENGKSTLMDGVNGAAGFEYAVPLPDRVLLARTGDHPTEMMELRGARIAFLEEFPEIGHLNVKRLKALTGTQWINARLCGKDNVKWKSTHSVFVTSNYLPRIDESDWGTWRRLLLVEFPHRYRRPGEPLETNDRVGDPSLRDRIRLGVNGQHEAALAWMVAGAVRWYANGQVMSDPPASVDATTKVWRHASDIMLRFIDDVLEFHPADNVWSKELYEEFAKWLKGHGHQNWSDQSFTARFEQHPEVLANSVQKGRTHQSQTRFPSRPPLPPWSASTVMPPQKYTAWFGVRFQQ